MAMVVVVLVPLVVMNVVAVVLVVHFLDPPDLEGRRRRGGRVSLLVHADSENCFYGCRACVAAAPSGNGDGIDQVLFLHLIELRVFSKVEVMLVEFDGGYLATVPLLQRELVRDVPHRLIRFDLDVPLHLLTGQGMPAPQGEADGRTGMADNDGRWQVQRYFS